MFDVGRFDNLRFDNGAPYTSGEYEVYKEYNILIEKSHKIHTVYYPVISKTRCINRLYDIILQPTNLTKERIIEFITAITKQRIDAGVIEVLIEPALAYINRRTQRDYTLRTLPDELKLTLAKIIELNAGGIKPGISSEKLGDYSITYNTKAYEEIDEVLKRYRKVFIKVW